MKVKIKKLQTQRILKHKKMMAKELTKRHPFSKWYPKKELPRSLEAYKKEVYNEIAFNEVGLSGGYIGGSKLGQRWGPISSIKKKFNPFRQHSRVLYPLSAKEKSVKNLVDRLFQQKKLYQQYLKDLKLGVGFDKHMEKFYFDKKTIAFYGIKKTLKKQDLNAINTLDAKNYYNSIIRNI